MSRATSLISGVYTSERVFELDLERIFYKRWLAICHETRFAKPGDTLVRNIRKKSILVVRGDDGKLRAFYNVCRHRGARLMSEPKSRVRAIQCPYHAWTFKLDGTLVVCPDMDTYFDETSFRKEDYPLYPVKLELWRGFVWVNLDPEENSLNWVEAESDRIVGARRPFRDSETLRRHPVAIGGSSASGILLTPWTSPASLGGKGTIVTTTRGQRVGRISRDVVRPRRVREEQVELIID